MALWPTKATVHRKVTSSLNNTIEHVMVDVSTYS